MKIKKREMRVLRALSSFSGEVELDLLAKHLKGTVSKSSVANSLSWLAQKGLAWRNADIYKITAAGAAAIQDR